MNPKESSLAHLLMNVDQEWLAENAPEFSDLEIPELFQRDSIFDPQTYIAEGKSPEEAARLVAAEEDIQIGELIRFMKKTANMKPLLL